MRVDANMKGALARSVVGVMSVAVDEGQSHVYRTQFGVQRLVLRACAVVRPEDVVVSGHDELPSVERSGEPDRVLPLTECKIPQVQHIALVGGTFDVMLLVRARGTAELRDVIFDRIQPMPEVVDTQTFLIFEDVDVRG